MIKAIFKNGLIQPVEPLPATWTEGCELVVDEIGAAESDWVEWNAEMDALAAQIDPEDFRRLDRALAEAKEQARSIVRKQMELS